MIRLSLARIALVGAGVATVAAAAGAGVAQLGAAAPVAAQVATATAPSSPSPSGASTPAAHPALKAILGRALHHRLVVATAAATGQTVAQVRAELAAGKSLDDIAGTKVAAIEKAVGDGVKDRLDKAVAKDRITAAQETAILNRLKAAMDKEMAARHSAAAAPATPATPAAG